MLLYVDYDIVFQEIPDETTLAIQLSDCPNRCKGCHSPHLWNKVGCLLDEHVLTGLLNTYGKAITCVCFMGGDAYPSDINRLAGFLQNQKIANVKVGWYSGRSACSEKLNLNNVQYIKLGAYIESLGSLKNRTTNQRLYRVDKEQMNDITYRFWT